MPSESIEILDSGQIYSSSESIGTLLYMQLFNPFLRSMRISAVAERCCTSSDRCVSVRLLGGDFGKCKSKTNRSMTFLWPGSNWQHVTERTTCDISLFFGFRSHLSHERHTSIRIHYIPAGLTFTRSQGNPAASSEEQSEHLPFQTASSPYHLFPPCDHYLNPRMNRCETLIRLRDNLSMPRSSPFTLFDHRSPTNHQSLLQPRRYPHLHLLIVATVILFLFYLILLIIVSIFICSHRHSVEDGDDGFSIIELPSESADESDQSLF